jgi:hypothetical protein
MSFKSTPYVRSRLIMVIAAVIVTYLLLPVCHPIYAAEMPIGKFSKRDTAQGFPPTWKPLLFPNIKRLTQYKLIKENRGTVIQAVSHKSASGLIYRQRVNPNRFSILKWQWKVEHVLLKGDLTRKQGDDYAARIYVAFAFEPDKATWSERLRHKSASFFAKEQLPGTALNYIWANKKVPIGTIAANTYTAKTKMIVVQSGSEHCKKWITEQRNLLEDYKKAFHLPPPEIIAIALMTDTDNTGEKVIAFYGDIKLISLDKN